MSYHHDMKLGLREANQRFSEAIRAVRAGRAVLLTDRGQPIAVIATQRKRSADGLALQAMIAEGLVIPASRQGPMPPTRWRPVAVTGTPLSRTIIDDREDRL